MYSKIYLDTSPVIYYLQEKDDYYDKVELFLRENDSARYVSSVLTLSEFYTYVYRYKEESLSQSFKDFIKNTYMTITPVDETIADKAARIRGEFKGFKMVDALHLATAVIQGCDVFLTNDNQLCQFKEIPVLTMEDLPGNPSDE